MDFYKVKKKWWIRFILGVVRLEIERESSILC